MKNLLQFAQKALIFKGNRILVVKNSERSKYYPGMLHFPGGRMKYGEDVDSHIKREVFEETGVSVRPMQPLTITSWTVKLGEENRKELEKVNLQVVAVIRACKYLSGTPTLENNTDDENLEAVMWAKVSDLLKEPNFDEKGVEALNVFQENYLK